MYDMTNDLHKLEEQILIYLNGRGAQLGPAIALVGENHSDPLLINAKWQKT
jgi:hypothetical protein